MSEWAVVTVIVTLVGLLVAIITPVIKLNTTITKMGSDLAALEKRLETLAADNSKFQERIWSNKAEQDKLMADHETRITLLERTGRPDVNNRRASGF